MIRVRFAPSPTGQVHIGNIRTAIFNYLFARHNRGEFLLRVEDTDLERSTDEAIDKVIESMKWLKLDFDGDIFYQSRHAASHREAAAKLLAEGKAYYGKPNESGASPVFFRIPDLPDGEFMRTVGEVELELCPDVPISVAYSGLDFAVPSSKGKPINQSAALAGFKDLRIFDEADKLLFKLEDNVAKLEAGELFKIDNARKIRFIRREVFYRDLVKGELSKPLDGMKDQIILRADGSPIFHLANVVDDVAQQVTHIVRGDDHVENTYRHILLFAALGYPMPHYAHLPMIFNREGKPYSKRDGAAFVGDFREQGFLPEALFNYLALLGWSPGDDREKMSIAEMVDAFELTRVKSAPAQFDPNKLLNLNGQYIGEMPDDEFAAVSAKFLLRRNIEWDREEIFGAVAKLMKLRTKSFAQVESWAFFFTDDYPVDEKNLVKQFSRDGRIAALKEILAIWRKLDDFSPAAAIGAVEKAETAAGLEHAALFPAVRLAVTGMPSGAELDQTLSLLGREKALSRLEKSLIDFEKKV